MKNEIIDMLDKVQKVINALSVVNKDFFNIDKKKTYKTIKNKIETKALKLLESNENLLKKGKRDKESCIKWIIATIAATIYSTNIPKSKTIAIAFLELMINIKLNRTIVWSWVTSYYEGKLTKALKDLNTEFDDLKLMNADGEEYVWLFYNFVDDVSLDDFTKCKKYLHFTSGLDVEGGKV